MELATTDRSIKGFELESNECIEQDFEVAANLLVIHGGITSASREVIRPVLDKYKTLYFYDMPYEGGVCDRNIFIDGVTPAHNTEILVEYGLKNWGKKVYTLAADYNYGQITSDWVKKYVKDGGGEVLGTEFFPLDATNFGSTISKIQAAKPDWIMTILVGVDRSRSIGSSTQPV